MLAAFDTASSYNEADAKRAAEDKYTLALECGREALNIRHVALGREIV